MSNGLHTTAATKRFFFIGFIGSCLLCGELPAQDIGPLPSSPRFTISIDRHFRDSVIVLPDEFIITQSDSLVLDSSRVLVRGSDYLIDYRRGTITLDTALVGTLFEDRSSMHRLAVYYRNLPYRFPDVYYRRKLTVRKDATGADSVRVSRARSSFNVDDIFGSNLQKSGSIVRGFTVGSNRDLSLNSGLRMQLSGKISSDIDITASLTDENTPIQPEGTTQTLQEFDKVFVEMRATDFAATLGDFNLEFADGEFARLNRKLQGARGRADYRLGFSQGTVTFSGAVPRGKYNTSQFQGLEGVQGPYRLTGKNNEREIIVIAGTERVYVNGEQQTRGETNDYTIDYTTGEVTFTPRRLITAASRIVIDFEYSDRQYSRSLIAAQTSSRFLEDKGKLMFSYFREADDPNSPIDFSLNDSLKAILASAGGDRSKAVVSGVTQVDSNGLYVRIDSVLAGGEPVTSYRFDPGNPNARYTVAFSFVGSGNGDYSRLRAGEFTWRGPGGGDYLPVRFIPLPQAAEMLDVGLDVTPARDLRLTGEFARSAFDANRLSALDDANSGGHALNFTLAYAPKDVSIGGSNIGNFDLRLKERYVDSRFIPLDRINDIEFNRKWGFDAGTGNEELQEAQLKYSPVSSVALGGGYGKITRGSSLRSVRNEGTLQLKGEGLPLVSYSIESVRSKETPTDVQSSWLRHKGSAEHSLSGLIPTFRFENENRLIQSITTTASKDGSFKFNVLAPGLRIESLGRLLLASEFEWRNDDAFTNNSVVPQSRSFTQAYAAKLTEWNYVSSTLDVTLRDRRFTPPFKQLGNSDIQTVLVKSQSRYTPFSRAVDTDVLYQVTTERSSRLERVFVRVAQGTGNYRYLGDLNGNGLADESEFELTRFDGDFVAITVPSDELFPVIDLRTSARIRLTPRILIPDPEGIFEGVLSALSTESYIRVEEKSTEPDLKQIYLLHMSRFQNDSTTIAGTTMFTQDINVFEGKPAFSARVRYSQRKGLNRFSTGIERNHARERSIRLRWQLVTELSNQVDYSNKIDRVTSEQTSNRVRDISGNSFGYDLSYRPEQNLELGIKFEVAQFTDRTPVPQQQADINTQSLRIIYAFQGAGQARMETSREEVRLGGASDTFPFELTGGRVVGKTWIWRMGFDYRVTNFIQATLTYDGRSEGGRLPVHTARAEVRAFF
jgi:hypothetical protein